MNQAIASGPAKTNLTFHTRFWDIILRVDFNIFAVILINFVTTILRIWTTNLDQIFQINSDSITIKFKILVQVDLIA